MPRKTRIPTEAERRETKARGHVQPVRTIESFAMCAIRRYPRISYHAPTDRDGVYRWIDREHARRIGEALRAPLKELSFEITTFESGGYAAMAAAIREGVTIRRLAFYHVSADEFSVEMARGLAHLIKRTQTREVFIMCYDFDEGALSALADELVDAGPTLVESKFWAWAVLDEEGRARRVTNADVDALTDLNRERLNSH